MSYDELPARLRKARRGPLFAADTLGPEVRDRDGIGALLPHRGTMLLLDAIDGVAADGSRLRARRRIDPSEPFFDGHFPGNPVYPGALQLEALGQAGLCLDAFRNGSGSSPRGVRLLKVLEATFLEEVRPGDELELLAELVEDNGQTFITLGQALRDGVPVSVGAFEALFVEGEGT